MVGDKKRITLDSSARRGIDEITALHEIKDVWVMSRRDVSSIYDWLPWMSFDSYSDEYWGEPPL